MEEAWQGPKKIQPSQEDIQAHIGQKALVGGGSVIDVPCGASGAFGTPT